QQTVAENALALLLGLPPQNLTVHETKLDKLAIPAIAPSQPSTLLERRPDIRGAEESLVAANADIGVARAAFFPTVDLGLGLGIAANPASAAASKALDLAASLAAPIFQGGRLEGGVERAEGRRNELVENYRKTVLTSFQEVENALAAAKAASA